MAIKQIPVTNSNIDHQFSMELERVVYVFRIKWNFRAERWVMDLLAEDSTPLLTGLPLVTSWPLLAKFNDIRLPPGELFVFDSTNLNSEPGEESFGVTHFLLYRESTT
jgi:hypothetical protein